MFKNYTALLFPILLISCVSSTAVMNSGNIWLGMTKKSFCNAFILSSYKKDPCFGFSDINSKTSYEIIANETRDKYFVFSPSDSNLSTYEKSIVLAKSGADKLLAKDPGESRLELITSSLSEASYFAENKQKRISSSKDRRGKRLKCPF